MYAVVHFLLHSPNADLLSACWMFGTVLGAKDIAEDETEYLPRQR